MKLNRKAAAAALNPGELWSALEEEVGVVRPPQMVTSRARPFSHYWQAAADKYESSKGHLLAAGAPV